MKNKRAWLLPAILVIITIVGLIVSVALGSEGATLDSVVNPTDWERIEGVKSPPPLKLTIDLYENIKNRGEIKMIIFWDSKFVAYGAGGRLDRGNNKRDWSNAVWNIEMEGGKWTSYTSSNELKFNLGMVGTRTAFIMIIYIGGEPAVTRNLYMN